MAAQGESLGSLGPVGPQLLSGLNAVRPRLAACVDQERRSRAQPTPAQGRRPAPAIGRPVLMLEIETSPGTVRILDAPVADRRGASDALVECAQGVLRGLTVDAPASRQASRHRIAYSM